MSDLVVLTPNWIDVCCKAADEAYTTLDFNWAAILRAFVHSPPVGDYTKHEKQVLSYLVSNGYNLPPGWAATVTISQPEFLEGPDTVVESYSFAYSA